MKIHRSFFRRLFRSEIVARFLGLFGWLLCLSLFMLLASSVWQQFFLELIVSWLPQFLLLALIGLVALVLVSPKTRHSLSFFMSCLLVAAIAALQSGWFTAGVEVERSGDMIGSFVVETHNVHHDLRQESLEAQIKHSQDIASDVIVLQEVDQEALEVYKGALDFQYSVITDCQCSGGYEVAVISRHFLYDPEFTYLQAGGFIEVTVSVNREYDFRLFAAHTAAPISPQWYAYRGEAFDQLAERMVAAQRDVVVAGDLNSTVWSPVLRTFSRRIGGEAVNLQAGGYPLGSYCLNGPLCIGIDHIFADRSLSSDGVTRGPKTGSDHHSLYTTLFY